jgi:pre-mRNA cleavage complex 2 protein Pcf11
VNSDLFEKLAMSARSPRGSLSGASSDEVAEDFAESLKELQTNDRIHISNLTSIAKEYTEHAQAISRVLENHINMVRHIT